MAIHSINRFPRGSIWWLRYAKKVNGSVQQKRRPVLVISNDYRGRSTIVEVLSLTRTDKSDTCTDINVPIRNIHGDVNYILCNQHQTVDENDLVDFMGIAPKSVMNKVDIALTIAQGIDVRDELYSEMDDLKDQIADYMQDIGAVKQAKFLQEQLANLSVELGSMVSSYTEKLSDKKKSSASDEISTYTNRTYTRWDDDRVINFIIDYESSEDKESLLHKYELTTMKQLKHKYYYCKRKLENA